MESAFAKGIFKAWFESNQEAFSGFINSKDIESPNGRAAWIQLDMPGHMVSISAWDQGNRLEVIMIDVSTEDATVEDDAYASPNELQVRLDAFLEQFSGMRD